MEHLEKAEELINSIKETYEELGYFKGFKFPTPSGELPFVPDITDLGAMAKYAEKIQEKIPALAKLDEKRFGIEEAISRAEKELEKARELSDTAAIRKELKSGCDILAFIDEKERYCTFVYPSEVGLDANDLPKHNVLSQNNLKSLFSGFLYTKGLEVLIVKVDEEQHYFTSFLEILGELSSNIKVIRSGNKDYSIYKGVFRTEVGNDLIEDMHIYIKKYIPQCLTGGDWGLVDIIKRLPAANLVSFLGRDYLALGLKPLTEEIFDLDKFYQEKCKELETRTKTIYSSFRDFLCKAQNMLYDDAIKKMEEPTNKNGIEGVVELKKQKEAIYGALGSFSGILREIEKHFSAQSKAFGIELIDVFKELAKYKEGIFSRIDDYNAKYDERLKECREEAVNILTEEVDGFIQRLQSLKPNPLKISSYLNEVNGMITEFKGVSKRYEMLRQEEIYSDDLVKKMYGLNRELPQLSRDQKEGDCFVRAALFACDTVTRMPNPPTYDKATKYKCDKYLNLTNPREEVYIKDLTDLSERLKELRSYVQFFYGLDLKITEKAVQGAIDYYKNKTSEMEDRINELIASFVKPKINEIDSYLTKTKYTDANTAKTHMRSAKERLASLKKNLESLANLPDQLQDSIEGTDRNVEQLSKDLGISQCDIVAFVCGGDANYYTLVYKKSVEKELISFRDGRDNFVFPWTYLKKSLVESNLYGDKSRAGDLVMEVVISSMERDTVNSLLEEKFGSRINLIFPQGTNYKIFDKTGGNRGTFEFSIGLVNDINNLVPKYLG